MFAHAAQRMGYHVAVWEPEANCPASQSANRHLHPAGPQQELQLAAELGQSCAAVTLEFENIRAEYLRAAATSTRVCPCAEFLKSAKIAFWRNRRCRSRFSYDAFPSVKSVADVERAMEQFSVPLVLKTARSGYDGKGQAVIRDPQHARQTFEKLDSDHVIAEKWIAYQAEVSMIAARNARGQIEVLSDG